MGSRICLVIIDGGAKECQRNALVGVRSPSSDSSVGRGPFAGGGELDARSELVSANRASRRALPMELSRVCPSVPFQRNRLTHPRWDLTGANPALTI